MQQSLDMLLLVAFEAFRDAIDPLLFSLRQYKLSIRIEFVSSWGHC